MKKTRLFAGPSRSAAGRGGLGLLPRSPLLLFFSIAVGAVLFASTSGCAANPRLVEAQKGTSCSAENVQTYAAEHKLTYEQALAELRQQDQKLWDEEEARQKRAAGSRQPAVGANQESETKN
jgi:hypothetical protein